MQHQRHGSAGIFLPLVPGFDTARRAGQNDIRHGFPKWPLHKQKTRFLTRGAPFKKRSFSNAYGKTQQKTANT
jgi:hypothetical protein